MSISGIYAEIYSRLATDKSFFPSLPDRALRLRESLNNPNTNVSVAAKILQTDPALSAFVMRVARSARFLSRVPPDDLEGAVRRIGLMSTSQLATTYTIRTVFDSPSPRLRRLLEGAFRDASKVAVISYFLADHVPGFQAGKAMLGGLLQDIAVPPILKILEERPEVFEDPAKRNKAVDQLCPLVGVLILKEWDFDEELIDCVRSRKKWLRDPQPKPDLSDVVLIARLHSMFGTPFMKDCPALVDVPAFKKLSLGELTPQNSLQIMDDSREELDQLQQLLFGRAG